MESPGRFEITKLSRDNIGREIVHSMCCADPVFSDEPHRESDSVRGLTSA